MHCILSDLLRGKAGPRESLLNSEVQNREFRGLELEIPKLWILKKASFGEFQNFGCLVESED